MAIKQPGPLPHKPPHKIHMEDDNNNKVDSLKSLNALLIKETVEKRQQVDSLIQSNTYLESEFNRSVMDNAKLQSEMDSAVGRAAMLEIEKGLVFVFMNQVAKEMSEIERLKREKESEIGDLKRRLDQVLVEIEEQRGVSARFGDERDEIRVLLDARIREVDGLRLKITEAEKNEARISDEVTKLKDKYDRLMAENADCETRIESVMKEKDDLKTSLINSKGVIDELKMNIAKLVEEKKLITDEKMAQDGKNSDLQALVDELEKKVESMRIEEGRLEEKLAVLEEKLGASSRNEVEMKIEIDRLVEVRNETERRIEHLANEKSLAAKDLEDAMKELEHQKLSFERIFEEKVELEGSKTRGESEIMEMNKRISEFKDKISSLEMCSINQTEKVKELEVEAGSYKSSFDQAAIERDEARKQLNDEKAMTADFKQTITRMRNEMKDLNEKLATLTAENVKHTGEKKELEDQCAGLVKEVAFLEAKFAESRMEFDGKLGAAEANSIRVLNILKKTVLMCDGNSDADQENGVEEGIKEHLAGIEAIKTAFKDKESRLEEMKRQLELVKSSAVEAQKEKSFWAMVSSATTLLAAVASLAYVTRAH
ncbi:hypothetical protein SSX86_010601 [Deinandra increscens subsp. villosa]|uniref:Uncharacterized protein n=1 Tax=Deinandra increscens subsp. villosa TaxID=3103831 RepID=A0AAP0H2P5_9ASTR